MLERLGWLKRILQAPSGRPGMLTLLTPTVARDRNLAVRLALAGGTLVGIAVAGVIGMTAFIQLMLAIGAIWFLATQVLGLKIDLDPRALYEQVQRQAAARPSYGPN
jgi:hypothetical protein